MPAKKKSKKPGIRRKTRETTIEVELELDGSGKNSVKTTVGFIDHMLELFSVHAGFDLKVKASGDTHVDAHHLMEDLGLCLGRAFLEALGDKKGIARYGYVVLPMDEALAEAVVDISGRPMLVYNVDIPRKQRWEFDINLIEEFLRAFVNAARITLHVRLIYGRNYHHCVEAVFKAIARALRQASAVQKGKRSIPSSKGRID